MEHHVEDYANDILYDIEYEENLVELAGKELKELLVGRSFPKSLLLFLLIMSHFTPKTVRPCGNLFFIEG